MGKTEASFWEKGPSRHTSPLETGFVIHSLRGRGAASQCNSDVPNLTQLVLYSQKWQCSFWGELPESPPWSRASKTCMLVVAEGWGNQKEKGLSLAPE